VVVLVIVLVVIGVAALVTVPLMIRSTRRQQVIESGAIGRQPLLGSPAQVWLSRGERVLRELNAALAEQPAFATLAADGEQVVMELRLTAGQVADYDHALAGIPVPELEAEHSTLPQGRAREAVGARLATAARLRGSRDALLGGMKATVMELEQARDELTELITGTTSAFSVNSGATAGLASRLDGLREGLVEVRGAVDPEIGPAGQGHP
jgi:hypothetical protein